MTDIANSAATTPEQLALGTFIRERRMVLGLTQTQLAERCGWVQERISLLEHGKYGMPSVSALARLAHGLDTRLFDMLAAAGFETNAVVPARFAGNSTPALLQTMQRLLALPATSLTESLNEASDLISEVMHADKIDALVYQPESDSLVALGTSNTPMGRHQHRIGMDRLAVSNGGREVEVFQTGEPYFSGRAKDDPGMLLGMTNGLGVQSVIIVPLDVAGSRRGVLVAETSRQHFFVEDDLAFMLLLGRWVGMVAERAELVERITAEAARQARRTAAEDLMTVLAHDLNNHLTPLRGQIDLLRRRAEREDRADDVNGALEAANAITRMRQLITELLDASRLDQGLFALSLASVDLVPLIRDVAIRQEGEEHRITLRLRQTLVVQADASRLCQSLENLLSNALQHSPMTAPITVVLGTETRADGEWAVIEVKDEGPGIEPSLLPTLFERYAKGTRSQGLGLGLYLARGVAQAHGGDLTVESHIGEGSTFRLSLPVDIQTGTV